MLYLRFILFLLVLTVAIGFIVRFFFKRVTTVFEMPSWLKLTLRIALITSVVALFASRILRSVMGEALSATLGAVSSTVLLGVIVSSAILGVERLLWLCVRGIKKLASMRRATPRVAPLAVTQSSTSGDSTSNDSISDDSVPTDSVSNDRATDDDGDRVFGRRGFMAQAAVGGATLVGGGSAFYATVFGRHDYAIEEVPIRLASLPPSLDGFSIVQLSDIHLGTYVTEPQVRAAVELVKKARPDLVVLTGDLIDHDHRYAELLGSLVRRLSERAPVAAIAGNHEYYAGLSAAMNSIKRGGGEMLMNRSMLIGDEGGQFELIGVDDVAGRRFGRQRGPDIVGATGGKSREMPRVLLCHNPVFFPEAAPHVDLQLSGHTHGGQFNPGVRPADFVLPYGYIAGHYRRGDSQLYVNRGFGTAGPPARLGSAPEVTKIVLTV